MQLTEDTNNCEYQIQAYHPGEVTINDKTYSESLLLMPDILIPNWGPRQLEDLTPEHLEKIIQLKPEIILLGTGKKFKMPANPLLAPIFKRKLSVECMDTGAACRTFIALSSEGRKVIAALLMD